jgi:hypothetical protein
MAHFVLLAYFECAAFFYYVTVSTVLVIRSKRKQQKSKALSVNKEIKCYPNRSNPKSSSSASSSTGAATSATFAAPALGAAAAPAPDGTLARSFNLLVITSAMF